MICLDEIVGYMTENSIWHLMDFLLRARFDKTPAHLNPYMIGVDYDEFCFLEKCRKIKCRGKRICLANRASCLLCIDGNASLWCR